jgi:hypothetical protein
MDYAESVAHLSTTLRHLHKELLDADAKGFGAISGPVQRLSLVAYHPYFARLRGLSGLLVDLGRTVTDPSLTLARRLVRTLLRCPAATYAEVAHFQGIGHVMARPAR